LAVKIFAGTFVDHHRPLHGLLVFVNRRVSFWRGLMFDLYDLLGSVGIPPSSHTLAPSWSFCGDLPSLYLPIALEFYLSRPRRHSRVLGVSMLVAPFYFVAPGSFFVGLLAITSCLALLRRGSHLLASSLRQGFVSILHGPSVAVCHFLLTLNGIGASFLTKTLIPSPWGFHSCHPHLAPCCVAAEFLFGDPWRLPIVWSPFEEVSSGL
jgi:hypothetical protein